MVAWDLFTQSIKKGFRKKGFYRNLTVNILLGLAGLYFVGVFFILGFFLTSFLEKLHLNYNPVEFFSGGVFYFVLFGLISRYFLQPLNTVNLSHYQTLPVKRSTLVNYVVLKPFLNPLNYFSLIVVIPFALEAGPKYYGAGVAAGLILLFVLIAMMNIQFASFLKRKFAGSIWKTGVLIGIVSVLVLVEALTDFSFLLRTSRIVVMFILQHPVAMLIPFGLVCLGTFLHNHFFKRNYYIEKNVKSPGKTRKKLKEISYFKRWGTIGEIMNLELRLILRHKRTKSLLYMSALFFLLGLIFYTGYQSPFAQYMGAIIITGTLIMQFGQWVFSWDSSFFDFILTKNISVKNYIKANYILLLLSGIVSFIMTTPYFFMGKHIVCLQVSAFLYNIGISTPLLIIFATFNTKRVDLKAESAMNYQGTTYKNFLIFIPIMIIPMIVLGTVGTLYSQETAQWVLAAMGVLGLFLTPLFLSLCQRLFQKRKYVMADGFRESE